jgi:diadenosine tetraphosphatase ApaH/serine/threonine PP2A family protein phosphatase
MRFVLVQVLDKFGKTVLCEIQSAFDWLPLATVVNGRVFVAHGGLPGTDGATLQQILSVKRGR